VTTLSYVKETSTFTLSFDDFTKPVGQVSDEEVFDAVFVCNGHYSTPMSPTIANVDEFAGASTMQNLVDATDRRPIAQPRLP